MNFTPYPKTPRYRRALVITEKIDGTNAQIVLSPYLGTESVGNDNVIAIGGKALMGETQMVMRAGSRTRWITPGKATDNYGFAGWAVENAEELFKLGEGQHFGEWYGSGIQRGYGLTEKRWALFNTARWGAHNPSTPKCCEVVPVLSTPVTGESPEDYVEALRVNGSVAVPGFMNPEGIIVYHTASKQAYKVLLDNDDTPKGLAA